MINAGIPTVFLNAADIGYTGTELRDAINADPKALAKFETIRAYGALRMGLIKDVSEAANRQHTPKVAFVAPRSEEHTSELQSLMRISYAVFCLKKKNKKNKQHKPIHTNI